MEMEDKLIIPVTKMGMGFGAGVGNQNEGKGVLGGAGGSGGGAGVQPVAVVVIFKGVPGPDGVKVIPLETPSAMAESLSQLTSAVMQKITGHKEGEERKTSSGHATPIEIR